MGRIIKYNKPKTDTSRVETVTSGGGYPTSSSPVTSEQSGSLWGNDFHGYEDIDDTMWVNGDIHLQFDEDDYDDSTDDEEEGGDDEKPSGSLYAEGKVEARQSVYGKTIYLDYPEKIEDVVDEDGEKTQDDSNKTDLLDVLKDHDSKLENHEGRISTNETKLADHETRISNNTTNITNLTTRMDNAETNISNNATNITNLQTAVTNLGGKIEDVEDDIQVLRKAKSVILATVELTRTTTSSITFTSYASCYEGLTYSSTRIGEGYIDIVFGVDTTKISNLKNLYANASIGNTQSNSDTDTEILNGTGSGKSCDGAYGGMWNHTRAVLSADKKTLVVRARIWHKDKDDNESVDSNRDWTINALMNISFIIAGEPSLV